MCTVIVFLLARVCLYVYACFHQTMNRLEMHVVFFHVHQELFVPYWMFRMSVFLGIVRMDESKVGDFHYYTTWFGG